MGGDDDRNLGDELHDLETKAKKAVAGVGKRLGIGEPDPAVEPEPFPTYEQPAAHEQLDLSEHDRLPWLEASEDEEDYVGVDSKRVAGAVAAMLAVLALIVGGIWWFTHRHDSAAQIADGSTIAAPAGPYKEAPKDPGGKTYDGTGDSSFAVSQGQNRPAQLAEGDAGKAGAGAVASAAASAAQAAASASAVAQGKAAPAPAPAAPATHAAAVDTGAAGGVVQVGAYTSKASAEAGWNRLAKQSATLSGLNHRIVEGKADIGTVFRVQALTAAGGGGALCAKLKGEGLACQVKH